MDVIAIPTIFSIKFVVLAATENILAVMMRNCKTLKVTTILSFFFDIVIILLDVLSKFTKTQ